MRAMFESRFPNPSIIKKIALENMQMITEGKLAYASFIDVIEKLSKISLEGYISIYDLYNDIGINPSPHFSKRMLYSKYSSGVVIGAGSGEDCDDLVGNKDWHLYDLSDERMRNCAIGYRDVTGVYESASSVDGDTVVKLSDKHFQGQKEIVFVRLDNIEGIDNCDLISMDVEGSALDVIGGSIDTIRKFSPNLLISIYHNWTEYLLIVPILYDMGYKINAIRTSNFMPEQPHLELSLYCERIQT